MTAQDKCDRAKRLREIAATKSGTLTHDIIQQAIRLEEAAAEQERRSAAANMAGRLLTLPQRRECFHFGAMVQAVLGLHCEESLAAGAWVPTTL